MTDTTTTAVVDAPKPTVAQTIERMVASSAAANPVPPVTIRETKDNVPLIYNSATGKVTTPDGSPPPAEPDAQITTTNAHEQQAEFEKIGTNYQRVTKQLEEHVYDPRTGQKVYRYPVGSDARNRLLLQATGYLKAAESTQATIAKLTQQDANRAELEAQQNAERQARRAFSGGDPRRAEIFNEALARAEAEEAARLVIATRKK